jgi:uncharacterized protein (TIGR02217 family)
VRVAVDGVEASTPNVNIDATAGMVTFAPGAVPSTGAIVTAGFFFDVPARFDTDFLEIDMQAFEAGAIPNIPIIEIVP